MFIQLDDNWALTSDEHQWILQKYQSPNDSYPDGRWRNQYFCTSFKNVVKRLAETRIRLNEATTLEELIKHAESVHTQLSQLLDYDKELE